MVISLIFSSVAMSKDKKKDVAAKKTETAKNSDDKDSKDKSDKKDKSKEDEEEDESPQVEPVKPNRPLDGVVNSHSAGLGVGETFLYGDFKKNGDNRIVLPDLYYQYSASYSFDALVNFHYSRHEYERQNVTLMGSAMSIKGKVFHFDSFSPFAMAGLGFYYPRTTRIVNGAITESQGKWAFGMNFGVGIDLRLNRHFIVGLVTHFHKPFNVKQDNAPKVSGAYDKLLITGMYTF